MLQTRPAVMRNRRKMAASCGNEKPQEDGSFERGDIDDDIDEQVYV